MPFVELPEDVEIKRLKRERLRVKVWDLIPHQ